MNLTKLVFVEKNVPKPLQREVHVNAERHQTIPVKGDMVTFASGKGSEQITFIIDSREFVETGDGYEVYFGMRRASTIS